MSQMQDFIENEGDPKPRPKVKRPVYFLPDRYNEDNPITPGSWFDVVQHDITRMLMFNEMEPDIRVIRNAFAAGFIDAHYPGPITDVETPIVIDEREISPEEQDKQRLISRYQYFLTLFGLMPAIEIARLMSYSEEYWEEPNARFQLHKLPDFLTTQRIINPADHAPEAVLNRIDARRRLNPEIDIMMYQGSFDPLHFMHLAQLQNTWMYSDLLLLVLDSDEYIANTKLALRDPERVPMNEIERLRALYAFPHVFDEIMISPISYPEHDDFIEQICMINPTSVVVHPNHEHFDVRRKQIEEAGSDIFTHTDIPITDFTSTWHWDRYLDFLRSMGQ